MPPKATKKGGKKAASGQPAPEASQQQVPDRFVIPHVPVGIVSEADIGNMMGIVEMKKNGGPETHLQLSYTECLELSVEKNGVPGVEISTFRQPLPIHPFYVVRFFRLSEVSLV